MFTIVLTDSILCHLNPVDTSLLCLCLCLCVEDTSITDVGNVAVTGNTPYVSRTVRDLVLLAEAPPVSCHNRKVSGYIVACPVIMDEGVFYCLIQGTQNDSYCPVSEKNNIYSV